MISSGGSNFAPFWRIVACGIASATLDMGDDAGSCASRYTTISDSGTSLSLETLPEIVAPSGPVPGSVAAANAAQARQAQGNKISHIRQRRFIRAHCKERAGGG